MLSFLRRLLRGVRVEVPGTREIEEGSARRVGVGDVAAGGVQILLCRVDGVLRALDTRCPHENGRIVAGKLVDGRFARCPLHGFLFDPKDGRVESGQCRRATTYRVVEGEHGATVTIS